MAAGSKARYRLSTEAPLQVRRFIRAGHRALPDLTKGFAK